MSNLSLIKTRRSRLAAWLGLLAVILLFIAPVISKSLVASPAWHGMMMPGMAMDDLMMADHTSMETRQRTGMADHASMEARQHTDMANHASMEARQHTGMSGDRTTTGADNRPSDGVHHRPLSMMDDNACGYCVLLAHLPLALTRLPSLWSSLQAARLPALPLARPVVARFVPHFFHPRAPPRY